MEICTALEATNRPDDRVVAVLDGGRLLVDTDEEMDLYVIADTKGLLLDVAKRLAGPREVRDTTNARGPDKTRPYHVRIDTDQVTLYDGMVFSPNAVETFTSGTRFHLSFEKAWVVEWCEEESAC